MIVFNRIVDGLDNQSEIAALEHEFLIKKV